VGDIWAQRSRPADRDAAAVNRRGNSVVVPADAGRSWVGEPLEHREVDRTARGNRKLREHAPSLASGYHGDAHGGSSNGGRDALDEDVEESTPEALFCC
jgi:hypothetical protein